MKKTLLIFTALTLAGASALVANETKSQVRTQDASAYEEKEDIQNKYRYQTEEAKEYKYQKQNEYQYKGTNPNRLNTGSNGGQRSGGSHH